MEIFVFSSKNVTNIWAGVGAHLWAVSQATSASTVQGRRTKSRNMKVGSFGILYCNEIHALTTPFIVYSKPDPDRTVLNVWPEEWVLPFKISPLENPSRVLEKDKAKEILLVFAKSGESNFGKVFHVQAVTAFSPTRIGSEDWEVLMNQLAIKWA